MANTGPVTYTVNYTHADTVTLSPEDVVLNSTSTVSVADPIVVSGTGASTRTVTISRITGNGTVSIYLTLPDSDVSVTNGTVNMSSFIGSGTTYTFNVIPTVSGTVTVNIAAGVAQDSAGNPNYAATPLTVLYSKKSK